MRKLISLLAVVLFAGCNITWNPFPIPTPIPTPVTPTNNPTSDIVVLGDWGGRPSIAVDKFGGVHIVVDSGGGSTMVWWDIIGSTITGGIIDAKSVNPQTSNIFNPSQVILDDGTQLVTVWSFAFDDLSGCNPPHVWYRKPGKSWQVLAVPLFAQDWNNSQLCKLNGTTVRIFGLQNVYCDLSMSGDTLVIGPYGNYPSGSRGGGEKEARQLVNGKMLVANSGCKQNGGSYIRSETCGGKAVMWASYTTYSQMGSDDTGHASVCADGTNSTIAYVAANYGGIKYNILNNGQLSYSADQLETVDQGWSGFYKYPLSMSSITTGGVYLAYANGGMVEIVRLTTEGCSFVTEFTGTTPAITTGSDGTIQCAYNNAGKIWYRRVK